MKTTIGKRLPNGDFRKVIIELDSFVGRYRTHTSDGRFLIKLDDPKIKKLSLVKTPISTIEWVNVDATKKRNQQQQAKKVVKKLIKKMINDGYVYDKKDIEPINPFGKKKS